MNYDLINYIMESNLNEGYIIKDIKFSDSTIHIHNKALDTETLVEFDLINDNSINVVSISSGVFNTPKLNCFNAFNKKFIIKNDSFITIQKFINELSLRFDFKIADYDINLFRRYNGINSINSNKDFYIHIVNNVNFELNNINSIHKFYFFTPFGVINFFDIISQKGQLYMYKNSIQYNFDFFNFLKLFLTEASKKGFNFNQDSLNEEEYISDTLKVFNLLSY